MRTSPKILGPLERAFTTPNWVSSTIWYYPVFVLSWPRRQVGTSAESEQFGA